jgi:hypothetical protein
MLVFEGEPPLSIEKFRDICSPLTKDKDFRTIRNALLNSHSTGQASNPILLRWQEVEFGLRNEIAKLRAKEKGLDPEQYLRQEFINSFLAVKAREIFETENPLKAEMLFNRTLWDLCDELEVGQMFNPEFLIIYHLRLQILGRIKSFNAEKGRQKVESILTRVLNNE